MEKGYRTIRDIENDIKGASYQQVHRAISVLRDRETVHPWHGENNQLRLTLDDARRVGEVLRLSQNGETLKNAVAKVENRVLKAHVKVLEEENQHLKALVERRPPWWVRVAQYLLPRSWYRRVVGSYLARAIGR